MMVFRALKRSEAQARLEGAGRQTVAIAEGLQLQCKATWVACLTEKERERGRRGDVWVESGL